MGVGLGAEVVGVGVGVGEGGGVAATGWQATSTRDASAQQPVTNTREGGISMRLGCDRKSIRKGRVGGHFGETTERAAHWAL